MVAVAADKEARTRLLRHIAVDAGFALTPSVHDIDLSRAYFVLADLYSFRKSPITTQRLFELAARGIAVMVGTRRLPPSSSPFVWPFIPNRYFFNLTDSPAQPFGRAFFQKKWLSALR